MPRLRPRWSRATPNPGWFRADRGFSLLELGISIAVIAVLSLVVIAGTGYFRGAKQKAGLELIMTIRDASRQFSLRHHNGVRFARPGANLQEILSIQSLMGQRFLPAQEANAQDMRNPWGGRVTVSAHTSARCSDNSCIRITLERVPQEEGNSIADQLGPIALEPVTFNGQTLIIVTR